MGFIRRYFESREKSPADPNLLLRHGRRQGSEAMIRADDASEASEAAANTRRRRRDSTARQHNWK